MKSLFTRVSAVLPSYSRKPRGPVGASALKISLALGYSAALALLLGNSYLAIKTIEEVKQESDLINNNYATSSQLLERLQLDIASAGIIIRDFVFALESESAGDYKSKLSIIKKRLDQDMKRYAPQITIAGERATWSTLEHEVADFWNAVDRILALYPEHSTLEIKSLMNDTVIKRRRVQDMAERLATLNQQAAEEARQRLGAMHKSFRRGLVLQTAACLLIGLLVAVIAYGYFLRLQRELLDQYRQDLDNKENLQRLSTHLVNAQEEERKVISQELHDQIGQSLTGVRIILGTVEKGLSDAQAVLRDEVREAKDITEQTIKEVREISHMLHPSILDDLGLIPALQSYIDRFARYSGIEAEFTAPTITERYSEELEVNLYRIVQEALCNVSKHAQAKKVQVALARRAATLELRISDDGQGFLAKELKQGDRGLGLLSMRERVARFGGELVINSQPGRGTHLYAQLSIDQTLIQTPSAGPKDRAMGLKKLRAFLVCDSSQWQKPSEAKTRDRVECRLLYRAQDYDIDLSFLPSKNQQTEEIIGQVLSRNRTLSEVSGAKIILYRGLGHIVATQTNQVGVFNFHNLPLSKYNFKLALPGVEVYILGATSRLTM
jgi:signal transduction histidine kinase